jgi:hypothetical protein
MFWKRQSGQYGLKFLFVVLAGRYFTLDYWLFDSDAAMLEWQIGVVLSASTNRLKIYHPITSSV